MSKTYIRTYDIFNFDDEGKNIKYAIYCYNKAIKCGIDCVYSLNKKDNHRILELRGSKYSFIKYYIVTLFKSNSIVDGVKRLISIITT